MSSPSSVLECCLRTRKGGWNKRIFVELIRNSFGADIVIAHYRDAPYGSAFFVDKKADIESISSDRCDGMWWIFAANLKMKIAVVSNMNMEYNVWCKKRQLYFDLLLSVKVLPKDCANIICDLINGNKANAPQKSPFTVDKIKQTKYHYMMISDQKGGLITCGLCMHSKINFIVSFADFTDKWWDEHEKSSRHQAFLR